MPKPKNNSKLRSLRMKSKTMKQDQPKPRPSEIYLCVLGNGAKGSPRALYMFTDQGRYLFNCGEGTQRLSHEHKMKLSKLEHIFVTHKSWENVGGLIGLSLTVQDIGVPNITLHGPPGIEKLYSLASFALTRHLEIGKRTHSDSPFLDNCMEVHYIPIVSSTHVSSSTDFASLLEGVSSCSTGLPVESHQDMCKRLKSVEDESLHDVSYAYVCKGHSKPGHLVLERCLEQGVPPGPLLGELKGGKDIVLPSGKVVRSQDVVAPEEPCPVFLVVECPSEDFLDPFVNEAKFRQYQMSSEVSKDAAALVVHFTPPDVLKTDKYRNWMNRFPDSTCHLILNADNSTLNSMAIHRIQEKLHLVHPQVFCSLIEEENKVLNGHSNSDLSNVTQADTLFRFYLRPPKGLDQSFGIKLEPEAYIEEATTMPGFHDSMEQLRHSLSAVIETAHGREQTYPEVIFLGTGSSIPSKARNVSGILVNLSESTSILLDCGEGTYSQMQRIYGLSILKSLLQKISCIFISHLHADHHVGLFQVLKERQIAFSSSQKDCSPVTIIAPKMFSYWLLNYQKSFEVLGTRLRFIPCADLEFKGRCASDQCEAWLKENCKDVVVKTVSVKHCFDAYGVCLTSEGNWKLVYSGDTVPCQGLVEAGMNCTLLIHEATMEDDLEDEAAIKMHSTTSQAISIAERMQAKYTILTHFSQRYAKVPVFNESFQNHIGCAFDNMRVQHCDFPAVPLFVPTLKCIFAQEVEDLQERGAKRLKKMQSLSTSVEEMVT